MKVISTKNNRLITSDIPMPELNTGEALIKVHAAGVNRADIFQAEGLYPPPKGASPILGLEVAGEIVEVATDASHYKKGDKVCALLAGGGYAEYATAPVECILPIPKNYSFTEAAALPETFFTVWLAIYQKANLQPDETLLVHAGASGIGTTAIQLATAFGSTVIATAGSDKKCIACESLGAIKAINYNTEDVVEAIKAVGKADVILDVLGGDYMEKNISLLNPSGRLVNIALLRGKDGHINIASLLMKNLTLMGVTLRSQPLWVKASIATELLEKVWPLLAEKRISPVIDSIFPLEKAQDAHNLMKSNQHIGKIILTLN